MIFFLPLIGKIGEVVRVVEKICVIGGKGLIDFRWISDYLVIGKINNFLE